MPLIEAQLASSCVAQTDPGQAEAMAEKE